MIVHERQHEVKDKLSVSVAADSSAQELGDSFEHASPEATVIGHRACLRKNPLAVAKRVGVLSLERTRGWPAHVSDHGIRPNIGSKLRDVELAPFVKRPASQEHFAALEEAHAPPDWGHTHSHRKRIGLGEQYASAEIRSIPNESE